MEVLYNLGCHICQGYLFARPMPASQIAKWVHDTQSGQTLPRIGAPRGPEPAAPLVSGIR